VATVFCKLKEFDSQEHDTNQSHDWATLLYISLHSKSVHCVCRQSCDNVIFLIHSLALCCGFPTVM